MSLSKKNDEIIKYCSEITFAIEEHRSEELVNRLMVKLLELVSKNTKCEVDIKEVTELYWKMKDKSIVTYRNGVG